MTTRKPGMEEDAAPFEGAKPAASARPLEILPSDQPAAIEQIADRIIERFPRILAKLAE